jgi:rare lipoprotein A
MQTKLRILVFSSMFVVSLLWTSPLSAANDKANAIKPKALTAPRPHYVGVASWYGMDRQGKKMANGKKFDRRAFTAASWFYPLGTTLHVVNLSNGNDVTVTVTDRGPNLRLHRVVDLSEAAAQQLGYIDQGLTRVLVLPLALAMLEDAEFEPELTEPPAGDPLVAAAVSSADRPN